MALIETIPVKEDYRRKMAQQLLREGMSAEPIQHWAQGLARLGQGAMGGYQMYQADQKDKASKQEAAQAYISMLGGGGGGATAPDASASPAAAPVAPATDQSAPRGIRNNNPLNIEAGGFTQSQPGYAGSDGRFARFNSPQEGVGAANTLLDTYEKKHGLNTVAGIINRWAPASDGNNVSAYAQAVSKRLGIDPNAPIPPEMRPQLIAAMGQHENGRPINMAAAQPQAAPQAAPRPAVDPRLIQLLQGNPAQQEMGMRLADQTIAQQFKPRDQWVTERGQDGSIYQRNSLTNEMKAIEKSDVLPQSAVDQKIAIARASKPETNVNIDQKGEGEFAKANAKHQSERFNKLVEGAGDAQGMVANVQSLRDIGSRITTGKTAEMTAVLGPYAESFGIKIDGLDDLQAYKAIISRIAPQMRVPGSGASSDTDVRLFLEGLPGLGKTPGGNEIISQTLDAFAQHKIAAGDIASRAVAGEINAKEAEKELRALPDPLTLWKKSRGKPNEPLGADKAALKSKYNLE